jgi:hypoxanthine-DNA glycosylase
MTDKPLSYSFPPLVGANPKLLILGSMPGVASLQAQQYYAHPRNAFWPIMAELFELNSSAPYPQRCEQLTASGIAVWDVLKACHRPGSLDQHIDPETIEANDFLSFLATHSTITAIFFNGGKAEQMFRRYVLPQLEQPLVMHKLPSTSPAHAALNCEQKLKAWQQLKAYC